jgi:hypothetical protein
MKENRCTVYYFMLLIGLIVFSASCAHFDLSLLRVTSPVQNGLEPLDILVDLRSLESAYSVGSSNVDSFGLVVPIMGGFYPVVAIQNSGNSLQKRDVRVQDASTLFEREISENICKSLGEKKGYALCRFAGSDVASNGLWVPLSMCTAFVLNLFGLPIFQENVKLDVEIEIRDIKQNRIAKYSALGSAKAYAAFYWGYKHPERVAAVKALKMALTEIRRKIERDSMEINAKLIKSTQG